MKLLLKNAEVVLFDRNIFSSILVEDNLIKKIGDVTTKVDKIIDCKGFKIFPGFIETHVHGGYGYDFEQNSVDSYKGFANKIAAEGVTKFLLASVTASPENISNCLKTFANFYDNQDSYAAKCLGVHLEGPFVSIEKKGAHQLDLIIKPDIELMKQWIKDSNNLIK